MYDQRLLSPVRLLTPAVATSGEAAATCVPAVRVQLVEPNAAARGLLLKNLADRLLSLLMILLLCPLFALVALSIKLTSRGPVFFRQQRAGLDGEYFSIWKFRTMTAPRESFEEQMTRELAELQGQELGAKTAADPRITGLGRFLRNTSLDELPQLFNVLVGDMSIVGPRPLREYEVRSLSILEHRRQDVRPGMTGLWQVSGRSDVTWEERIVMDLLYVDTWSLPLDASIVLRTFGAVVRRSGAY